MQIARTSTTPAPLPLRASDASDAPSDGAPAAFPTTLNALLTEPKPTAVHVEPEEDGEDGAADERPPDDTTTPSPSAVPAIDPLVPVLVAAAAAEAGGPAPEASAPAASAPAPITVPPAPASAEAVAPASESEPTVEPEPAATPATLGGAGTGAAGPQPSADGTDATAAGSAAPEASATLAEAIDDAGAGGAEPAAGAGPTNGAGAHKGNGRHAHPGGEHEQTNALAGEARAPAGTDGAPSTAASATDGAAGPEHARAAGGAPSPAAATSGHAHVQAPAAPGPAGGEGNAVLALTGDGSAPRATTAAPSGDASHTGAARPHEPVPLAERVVDALRLVTVRDGGSMRLRLEPDGLGSIDVRVSVQHDGVRALLVAEHDATRALLANQQHLLQAALERSELRLTGFSVDLGFGAGSDALPDAEARSAALAGASLRSEPTPRETATGGLPSLPASLGPGRLSVRV